MASTATPYETPWPRSSTRMDGHAVVPASTHADASKNRFRALPIRRTPWPRDFLPSRCCRPYCTAEDSPFVGYKSVRLSRTQRSPDIEDELSALTLRAHGIRV